MTQILSKIFSSGPFSAVRPFLGGDDGVGSAQDAPVQAPADRFEPTESAPVQEKSAPGGESLSRSAASVGTQVALAAFPQVVHLLVDPGEQWGRNISEETGLPVISLEGKNIDQLATDLQDPKFAEGFILEGFPTDAQAADKLDSLLGNVAPEGRRVLSWEFSDEKHQDVLDHYMDQDLLWMVPEASDPASAVEARQNVLSCLNGLPALK